MRAFVRGKAKAFAAGSAPNLPLKSFAAHPLMSSPPEPAPDPDRGAGTQYSLSRSPRALRYWTPARCGVTALHAAESRPGCYLPLIAPAHNRAAPKKVAAPRNALPKY